METLVFGRDLSRPYGSQWVGRDTIHDVHRHEPRYFVVLSHWGKPAEIPVLPSLFDLHWATIYDFKMMTLLVFPGALFLLLLAVILWLRVCFCIVTVQGKSMLPTLQPGDRCLVWRRWAKLFLRRGCIVTCDMTRTQAEIGEPPRTVLKRVIGLPGDQITFAAADLDEYMQFFRAIEPTEDGLRTMTVPNGHYFVKADGKGIDSRHWGALPFESLNGIVLLKLRRRAGPYVTE